MNALRIAGPDPEAANWIGPAIALLAMAAAAWLARRRSHALTSDVRNESGLRRFARLFYSAAIFGIVMALALAAEMIMREGSFRRYVREALFVAFLFTLIGMALFGIVQFWLGRGEPTRERRWLIRSLLAFNLMLFACLASIVALSGEPLRMPDPFFLTVFAGTTASALVWWAWLPAPVADIAGRFE